MKRCFGSVLGTVRWLGKVTPVALAAVMLSSCSEQSSAPSADADAAPKPSASTLVLTFTYGSEKEAWVKEMTARFNASGVKSTSGKTVQVNAIAMGSGDCTREILDAKREVDITSPASTAFVELGNAESRANKGEPLLGPTANLLLSPVVIGMWEPMAKALGWGKKPLGWSDILAQTKDAKGWGGKGFPQWGSFKFGHTHPEASNSGLIALFAQVYAATGKQAGLTLEDVAKPATGQYVKDIQKAVVHYGSSTGFFAKKMFENGPGYLSAAVMYENNVIEANSGTYSLPFPVVAIYPKEGTFWCDHPIGIVNRSYVTDERRKAAQQYIDFLLARPQQEGALKYGFRPTLLDIPLGDTFTAAHGVDAQGVQTTLEVPKTDVMAAILRLWHQNKKNSSITLVFDTSGSMSDENRIAYARRGGETLLRLLGDEDIFTLMPFSTKATLLGQNVRLHDGRDQLIASVQSLYPDGGTALYDSISVAYQLQVQQLKSNPGAISAVVVMTDGEDTNSQRSLEQLLSEIRFDSERQPIRIFTIGYGKGARMDVLKKISDATQARAFSGNNDNIESVFRDISTFF